MYTRRFLFSSDSLWLSPCREPFSLRDWNWSPADVGYPDSDWSLMTPESPSQSFGKVRHLN